MAPGNTIFIGDVVFIVKATFILSLSSFWGVGQKYLFFCGRLKKLGGRDVKKLRVDIFYWVETRKNLWGMERFLGGVEFSLHKPILVFSYQAKHQTFRAGEK